MKKISKILILPMIAFLALITMNCDEIGNFELNMPFSDTITISGSNTTVYETFDYCIDELDVWEENKDNIESINYLNAAVWVVSYSPSDLRGTVSVTVNDNYGNEIFSDTLDSDDPSTYAEGHPYELNLTADEIEKYNTLLDEAISSEGPTCFNGVLEVTSITGDPPYELVVRVEIAHNVSVKDAL